MKMKKFINDPNNLTAELLEGLALANQDLLEYTEGLIISKSLKDADRVTVVSLGGTGHEPAISGFVGKDLLDISIPGDIFAAPSPEACVKGVKMADKGKGVLLIVLNHAGDMLTSNLAMETLTKEGVNVIRIITQEDISNAPRSEAHNRRGLGGCIPVYKVACAAAKAGKSLEEVARIAQDFADNMATIAVASKGATHPSTGDYIAVLGDDEMEIGMGQHGEGGGGRTSFKTADETAEIMTEALIQDLNLKSEEKVFVIVNGSGATTLMEQLIVFRKVYKYLEEKNIKIVSNIVGEILTVQEQAGFQLTIARMNDDMLTLWNTSCNSPYLKK